MIPVLDRIHQGDVLEVLRSWPEAFVQTVVTSPPYWGLRDYGMAGQIGLEKTPEEYVAKMADVFREVRRVLRKDGTMWLNLGDCFASGAGGQNGDRAHHSTIQGGRPMTQKRDARKIPGLKPKDLVGIPWRLAFALQADGWYLRADIIWSKPNPMPESVQDRPTRSHEQIFLLTKSPRYFYDADAIKEEGVIGAGTRAAKGSSGRGQIKNVNGRPPEYWEYTGKRNKRTVWTVATHPFPEAHFATFPEKLIEPCILAGARAGDTVLDPFMGAGTTALVAARLNRRFLGIEINPQYVEIAERRIAPEVRQVKIF